MSYEGMAHLKLFKNKACTESIESNEEGTFLYNSDPVSNNALRPITFNIYVKNVGTHNAYDVSVRKIQSDYPIIATMTKTLFLPGEISPIILSGEFDEGTVGNKILISMDYNNV